MSTNEERIFELEKRLVEFRIVPIERRLNALESRAGQAGEGEHCRDCCCCARSWKALGVTTYTGKSIPEHIELLTRERDAALLQLSGQTVLRNEFEALASNQRIELDKSARLRAAAERLKDALAGYDRNEPDKRSEPKRILNRVREIVALVGKPQP